MEHTFTSLAITLATTAALMLFVWLLSLAARDVSIADIFWGLGFVLIALVAFTVTSGYPGRKLLVTVLTTAWGLRLSLYLLWRNWGKGEDFRYRAMRARHGARFSLVSLYLVFGLQGALMWLVSLPVQIAQLSPLPGRLTWVDGCGAVVCLVGILFEAVGDWQLARFKAEPANRGRVMDHGLWAYTRHPNYFGDAVFWWGLFLIAMATPAGTWTIIGPLTMTFLLRRVSGVALLERSLVKTRPGYTEYIRRTPALFPWFPRRQ